MPRTKKHNFADPKDEYWITKKEIQKLAAEAVFVENGSVEDSHLALVSLLDRLADCGDEAEDFAAYARDAAFKKTYLVGDAVKALIGQKGASA